MKTLKVSVIIPVYNAERYLEQAVRSIMNQTLSDIEIICIDDNSQDNSYSILEELAKQDNRIRLFRHMEQTDGAAEARNIGMRAAKGEYLSFLDADDYADRDMLEKAYDKAKKTQADVLMFDAWYQDADTGIDYATRYPINDFYLPTQDVFSPIENLERIFKMTHGAVWGRLFKKEFIEKWKLNFYSCHYWDDIEFFYVSICLADKITVLRDRLMHYRCNAYGNQTSTVSLHPEIAYKATLEIKRRFKQYGLYETFRIPLINLLVTRAFSILHRLDDLDTFKGLFWDLKERYLDEIGAYEIDDDEYTIKSMVKYRNLIKTASTPEEYLFQRYVPNKETSKNNDTILARLTHGPATIMIYGAGLKGRGLFNKLLNNPMYKLAGWVDRNYKSIGYPVIDPERVKDFEFDFIIVAIENKTIVEDVKEFLVKKGIEENKIINFYY